MIQIPKKGSPYFCECLGKGQTASSKCGGWRALHIACASDEPAARDARNSHATTGLEAEATDGEKKDSEHIYG